MHQGLGLSGTRAAKAPGCCLNRLGVPIAVKRYLGNKLIRIGLALVVLGWGPLWTIILLSSIGLWPDPNPNPIGPGLLFFLTAWPAIICLGVGFFNVRRQPPDSTAPSGGSSWKDGMLYWAVAGRAPAWFSR